MGKLHKQDISYKGQTIRIYQLVSKHNLPIDGYDVYEVCVLEGDGFDDSREEWKEPVFKNDLMITSDDAIELGKAFIDGMFHERANNQRSTTFK
jgi:hypothetical protein